MGMGPIDTISLVIPIETTITAQCFCAHLIYCCCFLLLFNVIICMSLIGIRSLSFTNHAPLTTVNSILPELQSFQNTPELEYKIVALETIQTKLILK